MEVRATSGLFQHRYYRINVMALKWTGQWPYHTACTRFVIGAVVVTIFASVIAPQVIAAVKHRNDWDFLLECIVPLSFDGVLFTKFMCSSLNSKKMLTLLNSIRTDWDVLARDRDVDILHEYAETGRILTIVYAVVAYATGVLFSTTSMVPKVIDILLGNGTKPGEFPVPVDYLLIDTQKYYFYLILNFFVAMTVTFIVVIGHDTLFIVYILHGRGLYAVLGLSVCLPVHLGEYVPVCLFARIPALDTESIDISPDVLENKCSRHKLQRIGKHKKSAVSSTVIHALGQADMDFKDLRLCIDRHKEAIEYTELIESTYSWCLFFVVGFNMFLIIFTGLQVFVTTIAPQETIKFVISNVVAMMLLFAECYSTQTLMDASIAIRYYILYSEWYKLPLKAQKILLQLIMRCNVPCTITAGKVFIMSMEMFNMVLKTSLSYFSFMRSM